jgi:hypothetical protein
MTDIAPGAGDFIRPWYSPWGGFPVRTMGLSTGISTVVVNVGMVMGLDVNTATNGNLVVPSSLTSNTVVSTVIVGIAAENSTTIGGKNTQFWQVPIWDANPNIEFRARTRNGLLQSTLVGSKTHSILWDSTLRIHQINVGASSATTPVNVCITALIDNVGDSGGAVAFKFLPRDATSSLSTANVLAFYV